MGVVCPRAKCMAWRLQGARCGEARWWGKEGCQRGWYGNCRGRRGDLPPTSTIILLKPTPPHRPAPAPACYELKPTTRKETRWRRQQAMGPVGGDAVTNAPGNGARAYLRQANRTEHVFRSMVHLPHPQTRCAMAGFLNRAGGCERCRWPSVRDRFHPQNGAGARSGAPGAANGRPSRMRLGSPRQGPSTWLRTVNHERLDGTPSLNTPLGFARVRAVCSARIDEEVYRAQVLGAAQGSAGQQAQGRFSGHWVRVHHWVRTEPGIDPGGPGTPF